jgi:hypothetical protein
VLQEIHPQALFNMSTPSAAFLGTSRSARSSVTTSRVSVSDYANFHGMVCRPRTASRCIDSFAGGTILFMPSTYTPKTLATFDCSTIGLLTPLSYYMLVLLSLTGLSTLLRRTDFRTAREFASDDTKDAEATLTSQHNPLLRVESHVLDYCKSKSDSNSLILKRCFEYEFKLVGLEVIMLHFQCDRNKLHLVEVYHFHHWIWQDWVAPILMSFGKAFRDFIDRRKRSQNDRRSQKVD